MLKQIIRERMELCGVNKAQLSEMIGTTPNQMGLFLKEEANASLPASAYESLLKELNVDIKPYHKRFTLANEIADLLINTYSTEEVALWTRETMISKTKKTEIKYLQDVSLDEFAQLWKSELVDMEGTYPFFKSLVLQLMKMRKKGNAPTRKNISTVHNEIEKELNLTVGLTALQVLAYAPLITGILGGAFGAFTTITKITAGILGLQKIGKK